MGEAAAKVLPFGHFELVTLVVSELALERREQFDEGRDKAMRRCSYEHEKFSDAEQPFVDVALDDWCCRCRSVFHTGTHENECKSEREAAYVSQRTLDEKVFDAKIEESDPEGLAVVGLPCQGLLCSWTDSLALSSAADIDRVDRRFCRNAAARSRSPHGTADASALQVGRTVRSLVRFGTLTCFERLFVRRAFLHALGG